MEAAPAAHPDRPESTVERLLDATGALIAEIGWDNTSSRKVAQRAGVSLGVVHYHVDTIVDLRRLAALRIIERFFSDITERVLSKASTPSSAIRALFDALAVGGDQQPTLSVLYQSLVAATFDEQLRRVQAEMVQQYRDRVAEYLGARDVPDAYAAASAIVATADGYLLQRGLDPDLDPGPVVAALIRLVQPGPADD